MKQTVNRVLRSGLLQASKPSPRKRFIVKPLDLGISAEQWEAWSGKSIHEVLEDAEGSSAR
jgi:hypothetical protein